MLNGRIYRAAFVPFLLALGIAAFSLVGPGRGPCGRRWRRTPSRDPPTLARLHDLARAFPRPAPRERRRRTHGRSGGSHIEGPRRDRGRRLLGALHRFNGPDDRRRADAHQRGRGAPGVHQRDADRDRRPPRRRPAAPRRPSCRPPPRCWNSPACSRPGTPSARSCSPPPAVAAAATRASRELRSELPARLRRRDRARRPRRGGGAAADGAAVLRRPGVGAADARADRRATRSRTRPASTRAPRARSASSCT